MSLAELVAGESVLQAHQNLVLGFFLFYGRKFDFQNHVVSVRNGKIVNKAELMLLRKVCSSGRSLAPFIVRFPGGSS